MPPTDKSCEAFEAWWDTTDLKQYFAVDGKSVARQAWDASRSAALPPVGQAAAQDTPRIEPKHICGLQGFNPMIDGPCLACVKWAIAPNSSALPLLPGTPRTDAAIKEATDSSRPDLLHYMNMTGVLNQLCRELEMELNAALAPASATSPSEDEARLLWLEKVLQHCPHAELTHNDDEDDGPVGWSLAIESCSRMDLQAPTLAALIDLGMNTEPDEDGDVVARSEGRGA